ncbi:glycosyltransferase family protein [Aestuariibaculum suncheonense]|uniref:Uncharacterized protein n=1 Tax=Aestuariibaculum suncheonense TaxID=1028745 RepID=A0A8J6UKM3_9FLAO|nr:hypothetical protein [Aestuariibaculum suncheonense]MBD0835816.1 hypothetical protein [Aestuariibaculum suncheonense]
MRLAIITTYPISKDALGDYAYQLIKHFRLSEAVSEIILLTNKRYGRNGLFFTETGCRILVKDCWSLNSLSNGFSISITINDIKPDAVVFDYRESMFGENKIANTLVGLVPVFCRLKGIPNINIWHQVEDENQFESIRKFLLKQFNKWMITANHIIVTNLYDEQRLRENYNINNISFVPQCINIPEGLNVSQLTKLNRISNFGGIIGYDTTEELSGKTEKSISIIKVVDVCVNMFENLAKTETGLYDKKVSQITLKTS